MNKVEIAFSIAQLFRENKHPEHERLASNLPANREKSSGVATSEEATKDNTGA
jgi:hypothetical protein